MGRLLLTFTDSISRKQSKKNRRRNNIPIQSLAFVLIVAAAFAYNWIGGRSFGSPVNDISGNRHYGSRRLAESTCDVSVSSDSNTTVDASLDIESSGGNYPTDLFTKEQRHNGAIILHIIGICWMFLGIAIICDDFFESSLEALCEALNMNDDVAGATFMAAGGSAPELFTSIMGVFVAKSDVGFGTIVGSAVFNVLFVIACCAFVCPDLPLTWWPLCRDSVYYCFSILALTACAIDQIIEWYEAVILLGCYALYVTVMAFNVPLREWTKKHVMADDKRYKEQQGTVKLFTKITQSLAFEILIYAVIIINVIVVFLDTLPHDCDIDGVFGYWRGTLNAFDGVLVVLVFVEWAIQAAQGSANTTGAGAMRGVKGLRGMKVFRFLKIARCVRFIRLIKLVEKTKTTEAAVTGTTKDVQVAPTDSLDKPESEEGNAEGAAAPDVEQGKDAEEAKDDQSNAQEKPQEKAEDGGDDDDEDEEDDDPPWPWPLPGSEKPESASDMAVAIFAFPLSFAMCFTVPHPGRKGWEKSWPITFIMCIVWIAALSFFMVWWAELLGNFLGIPPTIMGLTLLAGGTSIPDAMSSIAVAKRGKGDMAVSSSLGSNVFDILMGLPLPWFLYTAIVQFGKEDNTVPIYSSNITILILTLFIMVSLVITLVHWSSWRLTVNLGWAMMVLYFIFVIQSVLLEYNALEICPTICPSLF